MTRAGAICHDCTSSTAGLCWRHSKSYPYNGASGRPYPSEWSQIVVTLLVTA
jgi:hypothetical protein